MARTKVTCTGSLRKVIERTRTARKGTGMNFSRGRMSQRKMGRRKGAQTQVGRRKEV